MVTGEIEDLRLFDVRLGGSGFSVLSLRHSSPSAQKALSL